MHVIATQITIQKIPAIQNAPSHPFLHNRQYRVPRPQLFCLHPRLVLPLELLINRTKQYELLCLVSCTFCMNRIFGSFADLGWLRTNSYEHSCTCQSKNSHSDDS